MITVNGYNFRTLNEPIYVNNTVVKQAWTGGKMVYPLGDYAKIKYYINKTYTHSHDQDIGRNVLRRGHYGPCEKSFTVQGVAIQIITRPSRYSDKPIESRSNDLAGEDDHVYGEYSYYDAPILCCPNYLSESLGSICIKNSITVKMKMKYRVSSPPVCGPLEQPVPTESYPGYRIVAYDGDSVSAGYQVYDAITERTNGKRAYCTYLFEPVSQSAAGLAVFNDKVFAYSRDGNYEAGEYILNQDGVFSYKAADGSDVAGSASSNTVPNASIFYSQSTGLVTVRARQFLLPVNITKIEGIWNEGESSTDLGVKYVEDNTVFRIPAVDVLYSGNQADAPPEALTISNSELSLD